MKALKIIAIVVGVFVLLAVIAVGLALTPAVQTWAVNRFAPDEPGNRVVVGDVSAGLSAANLENVRLVQGGTVITAKRISAQYSAWDYLSKDKLNADRVVVEDLVIDLRQATPTPGVTAGTPAQPSETTTSSSGEAFSGLLQQAKLPFDVRVGELRVTGRALLPEDQVAVFELKGGGIQTGGRGQVEWQVDFTDATPDASLSGLRSTGRAVVQLTGQNQINLVEVEALAAASGPGLPPDRIQLTAKAETAAGSANETYRAAVAVLRGNAPETLFETDARFTADTRQIAGTWTLNLRAEQLAAILTGLGLPPVGATGSGRYSLNPDSKAVTASGELQGAATQLAQLSPALAEMGAARFNLTFDGGLADDRAQLNRLNLQVTANDRNFAQVTATQQIGYNLQTRQISFANPNAELARISVDSLPLAWAQPVVQPMVIESGELSLVLAVNAAPDGSRVQVTPVEPVTLRQVTVRSGEENLVEGLELSLRPQIDYSATRITAEINALTLTLAAGDSVNGRLTATVTDLGSTPTVDYTSEWNGRIVAALQEHVPVQTGPLAFSSRQEGKLAGDLLTVTRATTTVQRENGPPLSSIELQQPLTVNLKETSLVPANPQAPLLRVRLGEVPLAWAEPFVEKSQLRGTLAGGVFEVSMRSLEDLGVSTPEPVSLRGVTAGLDGQSMVQELDVTLALSATRRGQTIGFDVQRLEVKQGQNALGGLTVAGEATLGDKLNVVAKGKLDANVPALMNQPALAPGATLSGGDVSASFDVNVAEAVQATAQLSAKNLVARQDNRTLGDLELSLQANMKADGKGSFAMPLTLTQGQRKSDLNVNATFGKAPDRDTFLVTGKIASTQFIVDDFQPLAGLVPGTDEKKPEEPKPTRDDAPFWKAVNGKLELDMKRVVYGSDYAINNLAGNVTITDSRLALEGLQGRMNEDPFKLAAAVTFAPSQPKPYTLAGTANVANLRIGELLRAANSQQKPPVESRVNVVADLKGNGATLPDLAKNVYGRFDLTGSDGVLRALGRKGEAVSALSAVAGIAGALTGSNTTSAIAELTSALAELKFDTFKMQVERGADLSLKLTNIEFISPFMRAVGSGTVASQDNVPLEKQPMQIQFQFGAKDWLQQLLGRVNALGQQIDPEGYHLLERSFTVGGTPANPDSGSLWTILLRQAATQAAPALQDLLNRRREPAPPSSAKE